MGITELVFELWALKAKIKGILSMSYCCYGNLFYKKDDRQWLGICMLPLL